MKTYLKRPVITLTMCMALAALSCPSFAGKYFEKVNYADLNLEQPGDVAVLYERIQDAARAVCKDDTLIWGYHRKALNRCIQRTVDLAVVRVDNTALTALHQGRSESVAKR